MNADEVKNIRESIKHRLDVIGCSQTVPFTNDTNVKGEGLPLHWVPIVAVILAIVVVYHGF